MQLMILVFKNKAPAFADQQKQVSISVVVTFTHLEIGSAIM